MDKFYFHREVKKLKQEIAEKLIDKSLIGQIRDGVYVEGVEIIYDNYVHTTLGVIEYPRFARYYGTATTKAGQPRRDGKKGAFVVEVDWDVKR